MMTEKIQTTQPSMEYSAVYPTGPIFDDDGEAIVRSENAISEQYGDTLETETTREGHVNEGTTVALDALDAWLEFKVRNELVAQIFKNEVDEGLVNIADVTRVISAEMELEREKHQMSVTHIRTVVIPRAEKRNQPTFSDSTAYWKKDLDNLEARATIHQDMVGYIHAIQNTGEDALHSLAEEYIGRTITEARDEALAILVEQKQSLEAQNTEDTERIAALEETIRMLQAELADATQQIQERDTALLDYELEAQLQKGTNSLTV